MKKFDIIVAGDCNIDLIFNQFNKLPNYGEEVLAEQFELTLGSSAGITAVHLSALGAKVAYVGAVGKDAFGIQFKSILESKGVDTSFMVEKPDHKTGCTVVMSKDEDRANLTHAGAMAHLQPTDIPESLLQKSDFFHLSNPYVLPHFRNTLPQFFKYLKLEGLLTSLDPQWDVEEKWNTDLKSMLPHLDIFLPNKEELHNLLKGNSLSFDELLSYSANAIINTMGSNGVQLLQNGKNTHFESYLNAHPVDCIGAGDAFSAGLLAGLIKGHSIKEAIDMGCKNGALSTTVAGGAVAYSTPTEFEQMFKESFR